MEVQHGASAPEQRRASQRPAARVRAVGGRPEEDRREKRAGPGLRLQVDQRGRRRPEGVERRTRRASSRARTTTATTTATPPPPRRGRRRRRRRWTPPKFDVGLRVEAVFDDGKWYGGTVRNWIRIPARPRTSTRSSSTRGSRTTRSRSSLSSPRARPSRGRARARARGRRPVGRAPGAADVELVLGRRPPALFARRGGEERGGDAVQEARRAAGEAGRAPRRRGGRGARRRRPVQGPARLRQRHLRPDRPDVLRQDDHREHEVAIKRRSTTSLRTRPRSTSPGRPASSSASPMCASRSPPPPASPAHRRLTLPRSPARPAPRT